MNSINLIFKLNVPKTKLATISLLNIQIQLSQNIIVIIDMYVIQQDLQQ